MNYRGRFAPSPTGPLHFGSLVTAVGSYLDARRHQGAWLVRMEDLDRPRCVPGAGDDILRTLEALHLYWDESVLYQSQRDEAYQTALDRLIASGSAYPCACTRKEIADSALHGAEGQIYPGSCRDGLPNGRSARAWRVRTHNTTIVFEDDIQGRIEQNLEREIGDFVVKRADGLFAYQLAVVVDDAEQGITDIVRGADLLTSTARQIHLQHLLGLPTPHYRHLPVAVNAQGEKLSKQTLAEPIAIQQPSLTLVQALQFLRQNPPADLPACRPDDVLAWGVQHWQPALLHSLRALPSTPREFHCQFVPVIR